MDRSAIQRLSLSRTEEKITAMIKSLQYSMGDDNGIVMTHGDVHPRNIMVSREPIRRGGKETREMETRILDYGLAGSYREY